MVGWILAMSKQKKGRYQRGEEAQRARRELERVVRIRVVLLVYALFAQARSRAQVARRLGLSPGTLDDWCRKWKAGELEALPRGRPVETLDILTRQRIREVLDLLGPLTGVPTLKEMFPEVSRAELEHQLRRYQREMRNGQHLAVTAMRWLHPNRVWAMDFCEPPKPVDGIYRYVFVVKDLGSGKQLYALPTHSKAALEVRNALAALFIRYGPPLVIKCDNASEFKSDEVQDLLAAQKVECLLSPTYYPRYNGAVEAGIGTLKTYAHHQAARNDRPGEWTCDDVEAARLRSNELSRPFGRCGPSPDIRFAERTPASENDHLAFQQLVRCKLQKQIEQAEKRKTGPLDQKDCASIERQAIASALMASGILTMRRRRNSRQQHSRSPQGSSTCPPIRGSKWPRIT
jgi:transposase InsO family protein